MRTVTLDILKDEAFDLLKDLEALNVIRIQSEKEEPTTSREDLAAKYSGAMSKQSTEDVDKQLNELRNEWD